MIVSWVVAAGLLAADCGYAVPRHPPYATLKRSLQSYFHTVQLSFPATMLHGLQRGKARCVRQKDAVNPCAFTLCALGNQCVVEVRWAWPG